MAGKRKLSEHLNLSGEPFWITEIRNEISDSDVAGKLIADLTNLAPMLEQIAEHQKSGVPSEQTDADAKKELARIRSQAVKLRDSLSSIGSKSEIRIALLQSRLIAEYERDTGKSVQNWDPLSSLVDNLDDAIDLLDQTIEGVATSRGHPRNKTRDLLIGVVALIFRNQAPDIELSHKPSSLQIGRASIIVVPNLYRNRPI